MAKIIDFKTSKCNDGYYKGKYYPTFTFEKDAKMRPLRLFQLANEKEATVKKAARKYMEAHNEKEEKLLAVDSKLVNPVYKNKLIIDLIEQFIYEKNIEMQWKESTLIDKQAMANLVLKPFYGEMKLAQLTNEKMHEFVKFCYDRRITKIINGKIESKPLSSRRIQKYWEINQAFVNWLQEKGFIYFNPTKHVKRPKAKKVKTSQYWKKDEFKRFLEVIPYESQDRTLFKLAFLTGMRQGEILGLTWNDIDFKNNNINIDKQYNSKTQKVEYPKTDESVRVTKLPETVKNDLIKMRTNFLEYYGVNEYVLKEIPVFTNGKFEHYSAKTLSNHMTTYIKDSGVNKIKFHQLRNSFITNSIDNQISPDVVASMVGHKNVETTMNIYKCTTELHKDNAREKIDQFAEDID